MIDDEKTTEIELPPIKLTQTVPPRRKDDGDEEERRRNPTPPPAQAGAVAIPAKSVTQKADELSPWVVRVLAVLAILGLSLFVI